MSSRSKRIDEWNRQRIAFDLLHSWTCADGRVMTVAEMDTNHIRNAINKILFKTENWRTDFLDRLELEILYRNNTEKKKVSGKHTREQRDAENARRRELRAQLKASAELALKKSTIKPKPLTEHPMKALAKAINASEKTNARIRGKGVDAMAKKSAKASPDQARRPKRQGPIPILPAPPAKRKEPTSKPVTLAKGAPVIQQGAPREHTMPRSYVRTSGAGVGKLRSGTYQTTVSFTPSQMAQLVEAAGFRCVSLAEMIRSCVVGHLNKNITT